MSAWFRPKKKAVDFRLVLRPLSSQIITSAVRGGRKSGEHVCLVPNRITCLGLGDAVDLRLSRLAFGSIVRSGCLLDRMDSITSFIYTVLVARGVWNMTKMK